MGLMEYQERIRLEKEAGTWVKPERLSPAAKARANPKSMKWAIRAKCAECLYDYADGRYSCEMEDCSLFNWMPYKNKVRPFREGDENV